MDILGSNYMPGDPRLVQQIVCELKSQGIFDQFRKECIADVDTKPAYQNLRQRVESSVATFLKQQTWCSDINKNQVREQLRKSIYESGYLDMGVERIVDQVVNPKINTVFLPQVEEVVYRFLGLQKPVKEEMKVAQKVDIADLLPTDLEAVSPESVRSETGVDTADNSTLTASKTEEDESPPFEPLDPQLDPVSMHEENSVDSHLSGFSGLQSHDSNQCLNNANTSQMDLSNQDSQVSLNSSDGRLSIVISEDTKMDVDLVSKVVKSMHSDTKTSDVVPMQDLQLKLKEDRKYYKDKKYDRKHEEKKRDTKKDKRSNDNRDDKKGDKKIDSLERKDKKDYKHSSRSSDKNLKRSSSSGSKERDKEKYKEKERSTSKHSLKYKHKEIDKKTTDQKDIENITKETIDKGNNCQTENDIKGSETKDGDKKDAELKDSDKREAVKKDSEKKSKPKDKSDKCEKKEKDVKNYKEKADKEERSKDKTYRDKEDKGKDKSEKCNKEKSYRDKSDKKKDSTADKSDKSKAKDKSSSSGGISSSKDKRKDKGKETKSSSSSSSKHKDKTDKSGDVSSKSRHKMEAKRDRQSRDDHYSFKDKNRNRRSTDRDSNDGKAERNENSNLDNAISSAPQKHSSDTGDTSSGGGNNSGNSDKVESEKPTDSPEDVSQKMQFSEVEKVKYIKPKFASNLKEAMRIMKIRRQIAKLERQNQLGLVAIDIPHVNGIIDKEDIPEDSNERCDKVKYCEKVWNIILDRNDGMADKLETKEATEDEEVVEKKKSVQNKKVPDDKSSVFEKQSKFVLQTKDLSKESWEALEARLAEEMSNVDCSLYDYCDDNDYSDSEVVISAVKTEKVSSVIAKIQSFDDVKKDNTSNTTSIVVNSNLHDFDSFKDDDQMDADSTTLPKLIHPLEKKLMKTDVHEHIEQRDDSERLNMTETCHSTVELDNDLVINENVSKVIEEPHLPENTVDEEVVHTENNEIGKNATVEVTDYAEHTVIAATERDITMTEYEDTIIEDIDVSEEIVSSVEDGAVMKKDTCDSEKLEGYIQTDISDMEGIAFVEQVIEIGQDDSVQVNKTIDLNESFMLLEPIGTVEEMSVTADNSEPEKECRYLETPTAYLKKNLENLHRFIRKLEDDVKHCIKACQNNFAPSVGARGTKRKFDAIVDIRNNNKHHYEEKVSSNVVALERFSFPPSPADSEKSCDKKENEIMRPTKQRRFMNRNTSNPKAQRYSSEELYKPRPVFGSSRRSRGAKVNGE